jgi:hypothetical protein
MERFELSMQILREVLAAKTREDNDLLSLTQEVLECFEEIYKKLSELENSYTSRGYDDNSLLFYRSLEKATRSNHYEEFKNTMMEAAKETPEMFKHLDWEEETVESFKNAFIQPEFEIPRKMSAISIDKIKCPQSGPPCIYSSAYLIGKDASNYLEFRNEIRQQLKMD